MVAAAAAYDRRDMAAAACGRDFAVEIFTAFARVLKCNKFALIFFFMVQMCNVFDARTAMEFKLNFCARALRVYILFHALYYVTPFYKCARRED